MAVYLSKKDKVEERPNCIDQGKLDYIQYK